ncbi:Periplasmic binding protein [Methanothrix harundinacea 6Ac]|uniref:Periplasmic binding protein n=2 Tax=Methanothrix harundinacea TaxID=301375 RepID=G7WN12_METH6|nr:Periplasmic binding protein [Methanothrix harundinacea 6Ac]
MREISKRMRKIAKSPFLLLLAMAIFSAMVPAFGYEVVVPGDGDGDLIVSDGELEAAQAALAAGEITDEELAEIEHIHENYPRTVVDTEGREVVFYKPVERIITREPDTCRIVIALGEGEKVVASEQAVKSCLCPTTFETFEEGCLECYSSILGGRLADLPETSTRYDIYYELIASLNPDVIITSGATNVPDFESKIGCPVVVAGGDGWNYTRDDGLYGMIEVIGDVLEREDEAEELIGFVESKIEMVRSVSDGIPEDEKPLVYFAPRGAKLGFYDPKEGRDFTRTFTSYDPLDIAGGRNVAEGAEGYEINVAVEQIIAWNPDYIFVACSTPEDAEVIDWIKSSPDLQSIAAVQNGNVYNCFYPHCRGRPADRSLINMIYLAKVLHPEKFQDVDLEAEGNEIFKAFLGVDGVFTEYADYLVWPREELKTE